VLNANQFAFARCEVLTAKITLSWNVTPSNLVDRHQRFREHAASILRQTRKPSVETRNGSDLYGRGAMIVAEGGPIGNCDTKKYPNMSSFSERKPDSLEKALLFLNMYLEHF
jgi:hypothetical protein